MSIRPPARLESPGAATPAAGPRRRALGALALAALLLASLPASARAAQGTAEPLVVEGDPVLTLAEVPGATPVRYAAGAAGLYRSDDGGASWDRAGDAPPPGYLVAAADDPDLLLAGDHPPCARGGPEEPLARSDDGGATWKDVPDAAGIRPLGIWAASGVALGASCGGLAVSVDAGLTWAGAPLGEAGYEPTAFAPLLPAADAPAEMTDDPATPPPAALVAGTSEGGTSVLWRADLADPAAPELGEPLRRYWGLGALAARDERYLLGAADGVWVSEDAGATWERRRAGLEEVTIAGDPLVGEITEEEFARGFGIDAVAFDPIDPDRLYAGTVSGLFASADAGATWERLPGVEGRVFALAVAPEGDLLLAETEAAVVTVELELE